MEKARKKELNISHIVGKHLSWTIYRKLIDGVIRILTNPNLSQEEIRYFQASAPMVKDFFERHPGASEATTHTHEWIFLFHPSMHKYCFVGGNANAQRLGNNTPTKKSLRVSSCYTGGGCPVWVQKISYFFRYITYTHAIYIVDMYYCICMIQLQLQDSKIYLANTDRHCSRKVPSPAETVAATDSQLTEAGAKTRSHLGVACVGVSYWRYCHHQWNGPTLWMWTRSVIHNFQCLSVLTAHIIHMSFTNVILCDNLGKLHVIEPS